MRGSLKLFEDIITPQHQPVAVMTVSKQGRSAELHTLRNECLLDRYFYYINFTDKRYTAVLEILSREFFIAQFTIQERIDENYHKLLALKQQNPQKAYFQKKWSHLVW
ncbi:hypothetical protein [Chryseosolibacter indicus]|uniref:Uncharacterized protein n=1 Tax=Chryseosolibacter indicus TaxID=2782351 RepID=A0ABS5VP64_9BACT|nr:hypothetical protein [Chryseosolibacter indicus]MBT1702941.1 hypothetical protein [Chryseosolibacter indicus]